MTYSKITTTGKVPDHFQGIHKEGTEAIQKEGPPSGRRSNFKISFMTPSKGSKKSQSVPKSKMPSNVSKGGAPHPGSDSLRKLVPASVEQPRT